MLVFSNDQCRVTTGWQSAPTLQNHKMFTTIKATPVFKSKNTWLTHEHGCFTIIPCLYSNCAQRGPKSITLCFKNDLQQGGKGQTHSSYIPQIPVRGSLPQHADISTKHTPELHPPLTQTVVFQHQHTPRSPRFFINECRHHQVNNVRTSTCADWLKCSVMISFNILYFI